MPGGEGERSGGRQGGEEQASAGCWGGGRCCRRDTLPQARLCFSQVDTAAWCVISPESCGVWGVCTARDGGYLGSLGEYLSRVRCCMLCADEGTQTLLSALPRPALTTPGLCKCGYCSMQDAVLLRCRSLLCGLIQVKSSRPFTAQAL